MPSGHSHSSHSSSSSSHSSSHSHSSSSHSSSRSSGSYHSGRSHSSYSTYSSSMPQRSRSNQPQGFYTACGHRPSTHICRKHTYEYYDRDWEYEGKVYRCGYYDEEGNYYSDMAFKNNDGSITACVKCEYCGTQTVVKWKQGTNLKCSSCGAQLNVQNLSADEYVSGAPGQHTRSLVKTIWKVFTLQFVIYFVGMIAVALIFIIAPIGAKRKAQKTQTDVDIWGATVYLKEVEQGRYAICSSSDEYDKYMYWDSSQDSYYDYTTGSYVWYNTDVSPNLWQYWYDGISTDYEAAGYGWMEYEGGIWYIEVADSDWEELPTQYDTSDLWHIDNEFDYTAD